ncbi:unnamed protein product [Euphydryas editha]|uniref:SWIM-type domain-containing protein n=1 Tax=Euphydryas editha TaxID=104508 RepID=A0AAU9UPI0_EUPED|nr:unnamed protein product [Euphydryas editha]
MRTGDSNKRLGTIFKTSERTFGRMLKTATESLLNDFVPILCTLYVYLGFDHITRAQVVERNLFLPNALFGNPDDNPAERRAIVICDGSYIYLQKSTNYFFQPAIINAFHVLIEDNVHASTILNIINNRLNTRNHLSEIVERYNYNRKRAQFRLMSADMPEFEDFPRLEEEELFLFALGIYQLKQARCYYGEHIQEDGSFIIELFREPDHGHLSELEGNDLWMIQGRIQSRHVRAKLYYVYVVIDNDNALNGRESIKHYYCTCHIGKRTVTTYSTGCCAHCMTIVLNYAKDRHVIPPSPSLENVIMRTNN